MPDGNTASNTPTAMNAFDDATLRLGMAEGVLESLNHIIEFSEEDVTVSNCDHFHLTLSTAIHLLEEAREFLQRIPGSCLVGVAQEVQS